MFTILSSYIDILAIVSFILTIVGYLPEVYTLMYTIIYKKKLNVNVSNSIWAIWIIAALLYVIYASITKQYVFVISNSITLFFNSLIFILKTIENYKRTILVLPLTITDLEN